MPKAAIYHFTDESKKRPVVYQKQLRTLEEYTHQMGYDDVDVYCDMTLLQEQHTELQRLLKEADQYEAVIVKSFRHLSKNTKSCIKIMHDLRDKGIAVYAQESGSFMTTEPPIEKRLRVATYTCRQPSNRVDEGIALQKDIYTTYVAQKTEWTIIDQYSDISLRQYRGEQPGLQELIENKNRYDLLLVSNVNDIHRRTADYYKVRETLQLDIYSLQDGYIPFTA